MIDLLNLIRPLIIFDLETTGLNVKEDRIIELAALKTYPNGNEEIYSTLINPELPIPPNSSAVNGISDEDVKDAPTFRELSEELFGFFYNCDLAGYNCVKFDIPLLQNEFNRVGGPIDLEAAYVIDSMQIFKHFQRHRLSDAVIFYCGHKIEDAHEALGDVYATKEVLLKQLQKYKLPKSVSKVSGALRPEGAIDENGKLRMINDQATITFGKHSGMPIKSLPRDYLSWLIDQKVIPDCEDMLRAAIRGISKSFSKGN